MYIMIHVRKTSGFYHRRINLAKICKIGGLNVFRINLTEICKVGRLDSSGICFAKIRKIGSFAELREVTWDGATVERLCRLLIQRLVIIRCSIVAIRFK